MLTEETVIDRIEITEHGAVLVRRATFIVRDGVRLLGHHAYHRTAYEPGQDVSAEDPRVRDIAAVVWTPEVVAEAKDRREKALAALGAVGILPTD